MQDADLRSEWSEVPVAILRQAFGLQHNALDNCAAACTCSAWRQIANISSIQSLHLHDQDMQLEKWRCFLRSHSCIDSLTLTSSAVWHEDADGHIHFSPPHDENKALQLSDIRCKSLFLGEHLVRLLPEVFNIHSQLLKLSLQWSPVVHSTARITPQMPDLSNLTHLTELEFAAGYTDTAMYPMLASRLPTSLHSLKLDTFRLYADVDTPQDYVMSQCSINANTFPGFEALRHLEFSRCMVAFIGDSITCLKMLATLRLRDCQVSIGQPLDVFCLTNLTELDLTQTWSYQEPVPGPALEKFIAWDLLQVLKLQCTNIVDCNTVMHLANVAELHVDWQVFAAITCVQAVSPSVAVHVTGDLLGLKGGFGPESDFQCIVDMHVYSMGLGLPSLPSAILQGCSGLRSLELFDEYESSRSVPLQTLLSNLNFLQQLHLWRVCCTDLNLQNLTSLTSLTLREFDSLEIAHILVVPLGLQQLTFEGFCLFNGEAHHNLQTLENLTRLQLSPKNVDGARLPAEWQPSLPLMPPSLRYFILSAWESGTACKPDWSVLMACSNLEHLTVPPEIWHEQSHLQSCVSASRQLHIVDFWGMAEGIAWKDPESQLYHGTRLPDRE